MRKPLLSNRKPRHDNTQPPNAQPFRRFLATMFAIAIVLVAVSERPAFALTDHQEPAPSAALSVASLSNNSTGGLSFVMPVMPAAPGHVVPDHLPPLVAPDGAHGAVAPTLKSVPQQAAADEIFWRHSGHGRDYLPWFEAEQSKKHAAMTGKPQLFVMALVFTFMSFVTLMPWRTVGSLTGAKQHRRKPVHRLR